MRMPTYTHQPRLLWNIKANELLLSALKQAAPSDYNCRWIENLEAETLELKRRSTLYETFQHWLSLKFDPNQRRVPAERWQIGMIAEYLSEFLKTFIW